MIYQDDLIDVVPGKIAAVVTHLEMTSKVPTRPCPSDSRFAMRHIAQPQTDWYRELYLRVGAEWLWFARLARPLPALEEILHNPDVEIHSLVVDGRDQGFAELDFRVPGDCELTYFGVTPALVGSGAGRFLMNEAIARAWSRPIRRFWLHTCTLDHRGALAFYQRSGFVPFRQQIEIADDPRVLGVLPETSGPHVPIYRR